ncbi:unnamed protein product [Musa textilis]
MGVLRSTASLEAEIEEMRETLLRSGGGGRADVLKAGPGCVRRRVVGDGGGGDARTVCVTGGISFIGFAVVNRLLDRGYTVRLALQTQGSPSSPISPSPFSLISQINRYVPDGYPPLALVDLIGRMPVDLYADALSLWRGDAAGALCVTDASGCTRDLDKLRETEMFGEMGRDGVWAVVANVMDLESLRQAFDGCVGVFHTSSMVDPGVYLVTR